MWKKIPPLVFRHGGALKDLKKNPLMRDNFHFRFNIQGGYDFNYHKLTEVFFLLFYIKHLNKHSPL
jgi:hypothetical protein